MFGRIVFLCFIQVVFMQYFQELYTIGISQNSLGLDPSVSSKIQSMDNVQDVFSGYNINTFILKTDGSIYSIGSNQYGQLGFSDLVDRFTFEQTTLTGFIKIACSDFHTLLLSNNSQVYAIGLNQYGQLGLNDNITRTNITLVSSLSDIAMISVGQEHSLVLASNGSIFSFGNNQYGQLGLNDTLSRWSPTLIQGILYPNKIVAGFLQSAVITNSSELYVFGYNAYSQFGISGSPLLLPTMVPGFQNVTDIAAKAITHSIIKTFNPLTNQTDFFSCGLNSLGALALGDNNTRTTYTKINITFTVVDFSIGNHKSFFLTDSGDLYDCGSNSAGDLGLGDYIDRNSLQQVTSIFGIIRVSSTVSYTVMIKNFGLSLISLSKNFALNLETPNTVYSFNGIVKNVYATQETTYVLLMDNSLYSFGSNTDGLLCIGSQISYIANAPQLVNFTQPIQTLTTGDYHVLILDTNGFVYSCGINQNYQLGTGDNINRISFTNIQNLTNINNIQAGTYFSLFWNVSGIYLSGMINNSTQSLYPMLFFSNLPTQSVASGGTNTFIITNNSQIYGIGSSFFGEMGVYGSLDTLTQLSFSMNVKNIYPTNQFTIIQTNSSAYTIGSNTYYRLGINNLNSLYYTNVPQLLNVSNVTNVFVTPKSAFIITSQGQIYTLGANFIAQLGLGDKNQRYIPTIINEFSNVISGAGTMYNSYFITKCPISYSGIYCTDPVCFGVSSLSQNVCSAHGNCISPNLCQCSKESFGKNCQYQGEYFWKSPTNGDWNNVGNWKTESLNDFVNSNVVPGFKNEKVYFMEPGTYEVRINLAQLNLSGIYITEPTAIVTIRISGNMNVLETIQLNQFSSIIYETGILEVDSLNIQGFSSWNNTLIIANNFSSQGNLNSAFSTFSINSLSLLGPSSLSSSTIISNSILIQGTFTSSFSILNCNNYTLTASGNLINSALSINNNTIISTNFNMTNSNISIQGTLSLSTSYITSSIITTSLLTILNTIVVQFSSLNISNYIFQGNSMMKNSMIQGNITIQSNGNLLFIDSSIQNSVINSFGNLSIQGIVQGQTMILNQNGIIEILPLSIWNLSNSFINNNKQWNLTCGTIQSDSISRIIINDILIITPITEDIGLIVPIINNNQIFISGNMTTKLHSNIQQQDNSILSILNSKVVFTDVLNINNGKLFISGQITTPLLYLNTSSGMKLLPPYSLNIIGNFTLSQTSTLYLNLNGTNIEDNDRFNVTGKFTSLGFLLLKLGNGFSPQIGTSIQFINYGSKDLAQDNIFLFGAPYKNAQFDLTQNIGYFLIILSFGNIQNEGYKCHYIGNRKILEMNQFVAQKKTMISMTVPIENNRMIGFGFDLNGTISSSILSLSMGNQIQQYIHDPNGTYLPILDSQATISQSIFEIGPDYYTITLLVPTDYLINQKYIYYAEIFNQSLSSHYYEIYSYTMLQNYYVDCTNFLEPLRVEIYNIPITVLLLCFYVVLAVLCILFSKKRPLNTRGISPLLTLTFLFLQLILEIRNYFEIPVFQGSLCVFLSYSIYPLQVICFIVNFFYITRYFAIINLNEKKRSLYLLERDGKKISFIKKIQIKILKLLVNNYFAYFSFIFSFFILILINTIIIGSYGYICKFDTLLALRAILNVELILVFSATIMVAFIDLILNLPQLIKSCHWFYYIFDHYYFRIQIILYIPFLLFTLSVEIFSLTFTNSFLKTVQNHFAYIGLNTTIFIILLMIDVIFPLIITIIELIKDIKKKNTNTELLDSLLLEKEFEDLFIEFCFHEFSLENLICYKEIQKYRKTKSDPLAIYYKFLNFDNSIMEINCNRRVCNEVYEKIKRNEIDENLFVDVERELRNNLYDNYRRFIDSKAYQDLVEKKQKVVELIEGK